MKEKHNIIIKIPQMGEGLRNVRITKLLKKIGDLVNEDEVIYEMETDKSVFEIESPSSGYLKEWLVEVNQTVEIGSDIAILVCNKREAKNKVPNRVEQYCLRNNIAKDEIAIIPFKGKEITIEDVDIYITSNLVDPKIKKFSTQQTLLNQIFRESSTKVISSSIVSTFDFNLLEKKRNEIVKKYKKSLTVDVSEFQFFAYLISRISKKFKKLRTKIIDDSSYFEDKQLNLGIAIQSNNRELSMLTLEKCDSLSFDQFINDFYDQMDFTYREKKSLSSSPHIVLSYLGRDSKILYGAPLLVSPSIMTIFLGGRQKDDSSHISITFDHRLFNGIDIENILTELQNQLY